MKPKIASLIPSATEICFALGLGDQVVGVSHECDHPTGAAGKPVLTRSSVDPTASSAEIDRQVREQLTQGLSLYQVVEDELRRLRPELIVTQDTCEVCAVSFSTVEEAIGRLLGQAAEIISLSPLSLDDVMEDHLRVGRAAGVEVAAREVVAGLRQRLEALRERTASLPRPRVLGLEWTEPPMVVGHWTPELIRIAGGEPVAAHDAAPTRTATWKDIAETEPDVVLVAPCGFKVEQTLEELDRLYEVPEFKELPAVANGRVVVLDGNAFFNRPGPRLVESAELAALAIHPEVFRGVVDLETPAMGRTPIHWVD